MAKLAAVVDSLDAVPEPLRDAYTQSDDGKFFLDTDVTAHPGALGVQKKNQELIRDKKALEDRIKKYGDLTPEQAAEYAELQRKAAEEKQRQEGNFETWKQQFITERDTERKSWESKEIEYTSFIQDSVAQGQAVTALAAEEGNTELLLPHVMSQVRTEKDGKKWKAVVIDKNGNERLNPSTGEPMTVKELVAEMKQKDAFKAGFAAPSVTGSGATSSQRRTSGVDVILTKEQGKDPGEYRRAKAEAAKRGGVVRIAEA